MPRSDVSRPAPDEACRARVLIDHSLFTVFGVFGVFGEDSPADLPVPPDPAWLVVAGPGGALCHALDTSLTADVTLELWPPTGPPGADGTGEHVFHTSTGRVVIACITASPGDRTVTLNRAGDYRLAARRTAVRPAEDSETGATAEVWQIRLWPAESR
ncbi:hypothetical protein [Amycolatopsis sp. FDAARGOS 1241]|uniref:hypothetical protein n=1 Tax=Amycolatopsis sp. FDAARGOS 1241 TaxID=2778070 RepID=UPI001951E954|nr:hypothetical protein [Amycolatopsis sp. FDAARGOS 1241]QRP49350.1 hypothetical protein I6J71_17245 [Amycolatopsis sp. FDAARGOS 1241]